MQKKNIEKGSGASDVADDDNNVRCVWQILNDNLVNFSNI